MRMTDDDTSNRRVAAESALITDPERACKVGLSELLETNENDDRRCAETELMGTILECLPANLARLSSEETLQEKRYIQFYELECV